MGANRRTQLAKPAEEAKHMGIAAKLGEPADLGKFGTEITDKVAGNILILDHREGLQSQRKDLDLVLENLFEALSGLFHGIFGEVAGTRVRLGGPDKQAGHLTRFRIL